MKYCLIGGSGFIGQAIVDDLLKKGISESNIVVVDKIKPKKEVGFVQAEFQDTVALKSVISQVDYIILLAYSTVPKTSFENPISDIVDNVLNLVKFLDLVKQFSSIKKVNFISSGGAVYGDQTQPISELANTNPCSPYGITKLTSEKYCFMYHKLYNVPIVVSRPSNAYGIGQRYNVNQGFISTAIHRVLHNQPIDLFGESGTIRDYIYISDLARAISTITEQGRVGDIYNVGFSQGYSNVEILDMIRPMAEEREYTLAIERHPFRNFDVTYNVLDTTKIRTELGWSPQISLQKGIKNTWQSMHHQLLGYDYSS